METLPLELLDHILEHCDHSSLKRLRLVARHLTDKCTPRVFENFYMAEFLESLDKLLALSKSSLSKHVKSVTYFCDFLPLWSREEWETSMNFCCSASCSNTSSQHLIPQSGFEYIRLRGRVEKDFLTWESCHDAAVEEYQPPRMKHTFTEGELELGWATFKLLKRTQRDWRHAEEGLAFQKAFAAFPHLTEVTATAHNPALDDCKILDQIATWDMLGIDVEGVRDDRVEPTRCQTEWWHGCCCTSYNGYRLHYDL